MTRLGDIRRDAASAPIERLSALGGINPGELAEDVRDAFVALIAEIDDLRQSLNIAQRRSRELEKLVEADELTPTRNRRGLLRDLGQTIADVNRHGMSAALIFIDVDRLKQINDNYGHSIGDAVLIHVGVTLKAHVRESDSVARLGGDEFAVILRHVNQKQAQTKTAELMDAVAGAPITMQGHHIVLSISAGFQMLAPGQSAEAALSGADKAMYAHKLAQHC